MEPDDEEDVPIRLDFRDPATARTWVEVLAQEPLDAASSGGSEGQLRRIRRYDVVGAERGM